MDIVYVNNGYKLYSGSTGNSMIVCCKTKLQQCITKGIQRHYKDN